MFGRRKKEEASLAKGAVMLMDPLAKFMGDLHRLGDFGYVLFGAGLLFILILTVFAKLILEATVSLLVPVSVSLIAAGALFVAVQRILEHRILLRKLDMTISLTTRMVEKKIEAQEHLDTAEMEKIAKDVVRIVWEISANPSSAISVDAPTTASS